VTPDGTDPSGAEHDRIVPGIFHHEPPGQKTSMSSKAKAPSRTAALPQEEMPAASWLTPPWNLEERLQRIEAMGQRIHGYIRFICQVDSLNGTSAEAKERAVIAFYDRMVAVENQLSRIRDDLRLG
jgi:hypothetical protein